LIEEGNDLFVDEEYDIALRKYTEAIQLEPENAQGYLKRSSCYYRLNMYPDSLNDANVAVRLDPTNEKGYLRKGIAAFALEEFETARDSFKSGIKIGNNPLFRTWIRKCEAEIQEDSDDIDDEDSGENIELGKKVENKKPEPKKTETKKTETKKSPPPLEPDDDVKPKKTETKTETKKTETKKSPPPLEPDVDVKPKKTKTKTETKKTETKTESTQTEPSTETKQTESKNQEVMDRINESQKNPPLQSPSTRIKHDWTQTEDKVMVVIYVKNVKKEDAKIAIHPRELEVNINLGESEYVLDLDLCDEIIPEESKYTLHSTKIEINLKKSKHAKWLTLEASETGPQQWGSVSIEPKPEKKKGPKDWDKLTKEIEKETKEEGNLNSFFQDIFKNSDEDQRRAIEKSFYESGGTVLSTNWNEVGKGTVKGSAPEGQEMKYWKDDV
jgi:suppressor of G2 allele of SKP1